MDDGAGSAGFAANLTGKPRREERIPRHRPPALKTLHEDSHLHAIAKPAGWSTVSERWDAKAATVVDELWNLWRRRDPDALRPHIVHRLDKDTSGVLLFACHVESQRELRRQFRARQVEKSYVALVAGTPSPACGTIEIRLEPDPRRPGRMITVRHRGKVCETDYELLEEFHDLSWVRLRPRTGRTHQIRVSLQSIGTPCAIDPLYGSDRPILLSRWKRRYKSGRNEAERPLVERLTLHAESLSFRHPESGEPMSISAPLPRDLSATLQQLRRWARKPRS